MQMTIVFKSADATLSASVDVGDQAEAKKVVGELFAATVKLQNGHRADLLLKGWTANLKAAQVADRLAKALGVSTQEAKGHMQVLKTSSIGQVMVRTGTFDECKKLELELRDLGIQSFTRKLGV